MREVSFTQQNQTFKCNFIARKTKAYKGWKFMDMNHSFIINQVVSYVNLYLPNSSVLSFPHFPWESKANPAEVILFYSTLSTVYASKAQ